MYNILCIFIFITLSRISIQEEAKATYRGAVVQYHPMYHQDNAHNIFVNNAENYVKFIELAAKNEVDIIVFPEFGLTSLVEHGSTTKYFNASKYDGRIYFPTMPVETDYRHNVLMRLLKKKVNKMAMQYRGFYIYYSSNIPDPSKLTDLHVIPCETGSTSKPLRIISCAARKHKMYVVVNSYERVVINNSTEAGDQFMLYNTILVFDDKGQIVSRHRKHTLFYEPWANEGKPESTIFNTNFGVTFAYFSDFEIMDKKMMNNFRKAGNVSNIIYTTHFFDEMPLINTVQDTNAWARDTNMNLLSAGFNRNGGSNIYLGRNGPIQSEPIEPEYNFLMYADILKQPKDFHETCKQETPEVTVERIKSVIVPVDTCFKRLEENSTESESTEIVLKYCADIPNESPFEKMPNNLIVIPPSKIINSRTLESFFANDRFASKRLDPNYVWYHERLCLSDSEFCCYFEINMSFNKTIAQMSNTVYYSYRMMVGEVLYIFSNRVTVQIRVCAVVSCTGHGEGECVQQFPADKKIVNPTTFNSMLIVGNAIPADLAFVTPLAYKNNGTMSLDRDYAYANPLFTHKPLLYLKKPTVDVGMFGVNVREFNVVPRFIDSFTDVYVSIVFLVVIHAVVVIIFLLVVNASRKVFKHYDQAALEFELEDMLGDEESDKNTSKVKKILKTQDSVETEESEPTESTDIKNSEESRPLNSAGDRETEL